MADYHTSFSCVFDAGSAENAARAEAIRGELAAELDRDEGTELGFEMEADHATRPGALWIMPTHMASPSTSSGSSSAARVPSISPADGASPGR